MVKKQSVSGEKVFCDDPSRLYGLCDLQAILILNFRVLVEGQKYFQTKGLIIVPMPRSTHTETSFVLVCPDAREARCLVEWVQNYFDLICFGFLVITIQLFWSYDFVHARSKDK